MIDADRREQLLRIYAESRTIAVVGASADEMKVAHQIPRYLQAQGERIVPVNPRGGQLFGERVFSSLAKEEHNAHIQQSYIYNAIGNPTSKAGVSYSYPAAGSVLQRVRDDLRCTGVQLNARTAQGKDIRC
jgi:hypothetical protein